MNPHPTKVARRTTSLDDCRLALLGIQSALTVGLRAGYTRAKGERDANRWAVMLRVERRLSRHDRTSQSDLNAVGNLDSRLPAAMTRLGNRGTVSQPPTTTHCKVPSCQGAKVCSILIEPTWWIGRTRGRPAISPCVIFYSSI